MLKNGKMACCALALMLASSFFVGCGDSNNSQTKGNVSTTNSASAQDVYKFNQDQIKFLNSIGIKTVTDAKKVSGHFEFPYDGETIAVYLNDKNGITTVYCGSSGTTPLWDDKHGKTGLLKSDKVAFLDKFIDTHSQKYDQAQQVTWVDSVENKSFGHKGVYTYMGIKGREKSGQKWLRACIHYSDSTWVFFNKVTFSNTKDTWTYTVPDRVTHQVVSGGIHEYIDVPFSDLRRGMEIIAYGDNPKIDFLGRDYHDDKLCTTHEVNNARTYLKLLDAIESQ